jgi:hypothetical protein
VSPPGGAGNLPIGLGGFDFRKAPKEPNHEIGSFGVLLVEKSFISKKRVGDAIHTDCIAHPFKYIHDLRLVWAS